MVQSKLIIKKRLVQATVDQIKPSVHAIARLPLEMREIMLDTFGHEVLFKKSIMIGERPADPGDKDNGIFQKKVIDAFFKREESLEISVSSLMIGQTYVGDSIWDALGFELIVKRAFDTMLSLLETIGEFDDELVYLGAGNIPDKSTSDKIHLAVVNGDGPEEGEDATAHIAMAQADESAS